MSKAWMYLERLTRYPHRAVGSAEEAAAALSVSETLVRQLTLTGELPCRRIGRLVRYAQADIEAFVKRCDQIGRASCRERV